MELTVSHAQQLHGQLIKTNCCPWDNPYSHIAFDSLPHRPASFLTNSIIRAYARSPCPHDALRFFLGIGPVPDRFTFPPLLASCGRLRATAEGRQLHALAHKAGLRADPYVRHSLIHFYSRCGHLDSAAKVFDEMPQRTVVTWTSLIDGAVDAGQPVEALRLFESMQDDGVAPNDATAVSVLRACAETGALSVGRRVHAVVEQSRLSSQANVATALIDMYAKCGCIESAERLFEEMIEKDVFAWTAMISGLASHGRCEDAVSLFHKMLETDVRPNERTITGVLCACRNAGWVSEGYRFYNGMHKYGVRPRIQHYGCMVDLLARAGHCDEAEGFFRRMPIEPDTVLWRMLVWASKLHGDLNRAERLMNESRHLNMDSADGGSHILMANIYASGGRWEEKARVRGLMACRGIGKIHGFSRIEVNGVVHEFEAGDSRHPDAQRVYEKWDEVVDRLRLEGYEPNASEVMLDMEDEAKALQLQHHSERLAVAFGLISTDPGEKILVVKNLRCCRDCHAVLKLVSKIYDRQIVIRDRIKFHHFSNGSCSCRDYW